MCSRWKKIGKCNRKDYSMFGDTKNEIQLKTTVLCLKVYNKT